MKLDRNTNPDGRGKYALLRLRNTNLSLAEIRERITQSIGGQVLQFGDNPETEFFVIRLKDKNAAAALRAYSAACHADDPEFSHEVQNLALRAAKFQPKQRPT